MSMNKSVGSLTIIALNLYINLERIDILQYEVFIHEQDIVLIIHYLYISSNRIL